jgi:hypothetical protein
VAGGDCTVLPSPAAGRGVAPSPGACRSGAGSALSAASVGRSLTS